MNKSLFFEYIDKWFPSLSKIVEKVNEKRNGKLTYLFKDMLRKEYSVDQKWESASVDTTFVAADVVSLDSPLPLKKRDAIAAASGKLPKIGMKMRLGEEQINNINLMKARGGAYEQIADKLTKDALKCVTGVDERLEACFLQGLSSGITLVTDENNVGAGIRVNFGYKDANKYGVTAVWGTANATPVSDLKKVITAADGDVSLIMMSKTKYDQMRQSQEAKELAANYAGILVLENSKLPVPLPNAFDAAFKAETGCDIKIVDRKVKIEIDGKVTNTNPWDDKFIVLLPSDQVGALVYGTLAEETNPVKQVDYTKANEYTLVSKFSKNDPLEEFTSSQALALPVIENVDQIYQIDTTKVEA